MLFCSCNISTNSCLHSVGHTCLQSPWKSLKVCEQGFTREAMVRKRHAVMEKKNMRKAVQMQMNRWWDRKEEKITNSWDIERSKQGIAESERQKKLGERCKKVSCNKMRTAAYRKWETIREKNDCVIDYRHIQMSHQMFTDANSAPPRWLHINLALLLQMWLYWLQPWFTPRRRADWPRLPGPIQTKRHSREEGAAVEAASWA